MQLVTINEKLAKHLVDYAKQAGVVHRQAGDFYDKLSAIDAAYAIYQGAANQENPTGIDRVAKSLTDALDKRIEIPIVLSQIDTHTAFMSDIFLTEYPIFPLVYAEKFRTIGEKTEAVMEYYARQAGWRHQLYKAFLDSGKYNLAITDTYWDYEEYKTVKTGTMATTVAGGSPEYDWQKHGMNYIKWVDPYMAFWDLRLFHRPNDMARDGEHSGYHELVNRVQLKRLLNNLRHVDEKKVYRENEAMESVFDWADAQQYMRTRPSISEFVNANREFQIMNVWQYLHNTPTNMTAALRHSSGLYLWTKLYYRIIPSDWGLKWNRPNTPQVVKAYIVNMRYLVAVERVGNYFNTFPMNVAMPRDDGFGYQAKSLAEYMLPFQDVVTELVDIRRASARRALGDRAIYDPKYLKPTDMNTTAAAAKIPLSQSLAMATKGIDQIYKAIPFEGSALSSINQDIALWQQWPEHISGINQSQEGRFRKGNRSATEFRETMSNSDSRVNQPALMIENTIMTPIKNATKANIIENITDEQIPSYVTGDIIKISAAEVRDYMMEFKLSDGYTPRERMLNLKGMMEAYGAMASDPELNKEYDRAKYFAHLAAMSGMPSLEQFRRAEDAPERIAYLAQFGIPPGGAEPGAPGGGEGAPQ